MNKCENCGTEFEGKFCPECGRCATDGGACPNCGAPRKGGEKFCSECGYSFADGTPPAESTEQKREPRERKSREPKPPREKREKLPEGTPADRKTYETLRFLPSVLVALFAAVCFAFFAADAGVMSATGLSVSTGSIYEVAFKGTGALSVTLKAMFAFTAVTLVVSIIWMTFVFKNSLKGTTFKIAGKPCLYTALFNVLGVALTFAVMIISSVACVQLKAAFGVVGELEEIGVTVKPAAGLVLVLVFSILFGLATAACPIGRLYIASGAPAIKQKEIEYFTSLMPVYDVNTVDGQRNILRDVKKAVFRNKLHDFTLATIFIPPVAILAFSCYQSAKLKEFKPDKQKSGTRNKIIISVGFLCISAALLTIMEILFWTTLALNRVVVCVATAYLSSATLFSLVSLFIALSMLPLNSRLARIYNIEDEFAEKCEEADVEKLETAYGTAVGAKRARKYGGDAWALIQPLLTAVFFGVLVVSLIFGTVDLIFTSSRFAEKWSVDGQYFEESNAKSLFGEPTYESTDNDNYMEYYNNSYAKIYKRMKELEAKIKTAPPDDVPELTKELANLTEEAAGMEYKYIYVDKYEVLFDNSGNKGALFGGEAEYEIDRFELSKYTVTLRSGVYDNYNEIVVKIWFTDGSYHSAFIQKATVTGISGTTGTLRWNDEYFNVTVETKVTVNQSA